jgi:hypothetical protein
MPKSSGTDKGVASDWYTHPGVSANAGADQGVAAYGSSVARITRIASSTYTHIRAA